MLYGDLQFFDIIIFAGIAAFLIYRLRNVLGKRGGIERKTSRNETVPELVKSEKKDLPTLKDNEIELAKVYKAMPDFNHKNFLEGAKYAFETIINAFNSSDKKTLKNLLTKDVYQSFDKAIDEGSNNPNFQFYSLVIDNVERVEVEKNDISITLKIISEQFKENDESTVTKKQDTWTFRKNINSKSSI